MTDTVVSTEVASPEVQTPSETVEVNQEVVTQEVKSEDAAPEEKAETPEELKKRLEKAQSKIERQKAANRDQQRQYREMQAKIAEYEAKLKPDDGRPKEEDFDDYGEFKKAEGKWEVQQELKAQESKANEPSPEEVQKQSIEQAKKQLEFQAAQTAYIAQKPDYEKNAGVVNQFLALANPKSPSFKVFGEFALDTSNKGLEIIDHLGANPTKCLELFQMQPDDLREALEEIRDTLDAPKKPKVDLPEPVNPLGAAKSRPSKSMDEMSGRELLDKIYGRAKKS